MNPAFFDVYDVVFMMHSNNITEVMITDVTIKRKAVRGILSKKVNQMVSYNVQRVCDKIQLIDIDQRNLFDTREKLIQSF